MAFVPVPNTLEVEVVYELDSQVVENTMYFESAEGWDIGAVVTWLDMLNTLIQSEVLPLLHQSITLVRLVGTLLDAVDALSYSMSVSPPVSGSVNGDVQPNNSAYTLTFLTAGRGRSNRGRNYITAIPVNAMATQNTVTSGFRTGLLDAYTAIKAAAIDNGTPMVVVSRYSGVDGDGKPIPRVTGVTSPITSFTTYDDVLDSQRRRLPGRGT